MVSIVTITYNNYDELVKTLNSLPDSDFIESVVINGGKCEKTKEFLKTFSGKSISEKDNGIADAFNKGVNLSSGQYIMFLNSGDELIDKLYPEKAIEILGKNYNNEFVHSNLLFIDENRNQLFMRPQMKSIGRGMPYLHPTMIVKKRLFDQIGLFNTKLKIAMDFDWIARLERNKISGYYFNDTAVVKMDGKGKSVFEESEAINECYTSLKNNDLLNLKNSIGFMVRYTLYLGRVSMVKIGLKNILVRMKKIKYSR